MDKWNERAKDALVKSIIHWESMRDKPLDETHSPHADECELCKQFYQREQTCISCPLHRLVGDCDDDNKLNPFNRAADHLRGLRTGRAGANEVHTREACDDMLSILERALGKTTMGWSAPKHITNYNAAREDIPSGTFYFKGFSGDYDLQKFCMMTDEGYVDMEDGMCYTVDQVNIGKLATEPEVREMFMQILNRVDIKEGNDES